MSEQWIDTELQGSRSEEQDQVGTVTSPAESPRAQDKARALGDAVTLGFEMGCLLDDYGAASEASTVTARASISDDMVITGEIDERAARVRAVTEALRSLGLSDLNPQLSRTIASVEVAAQNRYITEDQARRAVFALHVQAVEFLSMLRLAKAYGIGRGLAALSRSTVAGEVASIFNEAGFVHIEEWLDDLQWELSPGVVQIVREGLSSWRRWAEGVDVEQQATDVGPQMRRYQLLLSGALAPRRMLSPNDYGRAGLTFARRLRRLVATLVLQNSVYLLIAVAVVGIMSFCLQAVSALSETERVAIDIAVGIAGLTLSTLQISTIVKRTLGRLEPALWDEVLLQNAAQQVTRIPEHSAPALDRPIDADEEWAFLGFFSFSSPAPAISTQETSVISSAPDDFAPSPTRLPPLIDPVAISEQVAEPEERSLLEQIAEVPEAPSRRRRRSLLTFASAILLVVALGALLRGFVLSSYYVPSGSMTPTLDVGDRILVDKLPFVRDHINRGDVIVFSRPATDHIAGSDALLVKRVIGLPGDRLSSVGDTIYVNGRPLTEPWLAPLTTSCAEASYNIPNEVVPPGSYFVLGDCRANSADSRVWGTVPATNVIGKVFLVYWRNDHPWFHWL